jgi:hypothetical protein
MKVTEFICHFGNYHSGLVLYRNYVKFTLIK